MTSGDSTFYRCFEEEVLTTSCRPSLNRKSFHIALFRRTGQAFTFRRRLVDLQLIQGVTGLEDERVGGFLISTLWQSTDTISDDSVLTDAQIETSFEE